MKYSILILFIILFLFSCGYNCPGYDLENPNSIKFRVGDTIKYQSNKLDTILLIVNDFYAQRATHYGGFVMDFECYPEAYYTTYADDIFGINIKEVDEQNWKKIFFFCNDDIYDLCEGIDDYKINILDSLVINNTTYNHVMEIIDLSNARRISSFIYTPQFGVIKFYDSLTELTWGQINI